MKFQYQTDRRLDGKSIVSHRATPPTCDLFYNIKRESLIRLMKSAGLATTKTYSRLISDKHDIKLDVDVIRCMIRLARAGASASAQTPSGPERQQHGKTSLRAPLIEERVIEDEDGVLKWEVRLTSFGIAERSRITTPN
jgi:hypothetical protein